jgi:radical SAM protein with 4Fe4S-binding SPASM domain
MNKATKQNLQRKSVYIDQVTFHDGKPLFSWIDINLTELCNRKCLFCPREDESKYPNQALHMSSQLITKIANELKAINYTGSIVLSGFSEPLLHPDIHTLVNEFKEIRLEMVTNGDLLTSEKIQTLVNNGIDLFAISMYDGPHQVEHFNTMFAKANIPKEYYILRDRWHSDEDEFGLKLTNRAGTVLVGNQEPVDITKPCYYTHYSMTIDWNGDVLLCVQDWNKKIKFGNLYQDSLIDIWHKQLFNKYRNHLGNGDRSLTPCNQCNTDGTLHGFNHVNEWKFNN